MIKLAVITITRAKLRSRLAGFFPTKVFRIHPPGSHCDILGGGHILSYSLFCWIGWHNGGPHKSSVGPCVG
jgi:hypothetical protein